MQMSQRKYHAAARTKVVAFCAEVATATVRLSHTERTQENNSKTVTEIIIIKALGDDEGNTNTQLWKTSYENLHTLHQQFT